jgi:hypothetical protein
MMIDLAKDEHLLIPAYNISKKNSTNMEES